MKDAIEKILMSYSQYDDFVSKKEFYLRIENPPFMPLSIERHGSTITVTHYFEQNGDLIPDPDMEFSILPDGSWMPVAIQYSTGHYVRVGKEVGGKMIEQKVLHELDNFARIWASNLLNQGFCRNKMTPVDSIDHNRSFC